MTHRGRMEIERHRADCFRLLAACFYPPERDMLLGERVCENLIALFGKICPPAVEHGKGMRENLGSGTDDDLLVDYARLFVGPFELRAAPYGSVYLEEGRRIMGDTTMAVRDAYRNEGLGLDAKEAPDHIAVELEFMGFLALRTCERGNGAACSGVESGLQRQHDFMGRFLLPWVSPFSAAIRQGAENGFYRSLADCLEVFLVSDYSSLGTTLSKRRAVA